MNTIKSSELYKEALELIVGGVSSPSRSFKKVGLNHPLFINKAQGSYLWDVDNNKYIDYLAAFGPIILGHAHPKLNDALYSALQNGTLYGAPAEIELEFAKFLTEKIPSCEKIRFVNSGTEAVMTTVRLARGYIKKDKVLKFSGCYHGHFDLVLVAAGSGPSTLGIPDSEGVTKSSLGEVITVPFNNPEALANAMKIHGDTIAAILVEPVVGNFGIVPPTEGFLSYINKIAKEYGSLVIYDEVITAFRFHHGAVQDLYNVKPDLTALGKIIGGGLPIGAYGGRKDIMDHIAPIGGVYQAGTLAGNPLSLKAGLTCLKILEEKDTYKRLNDFGVLLADAIRGLAAEYQIDVQVNQLGGALGIYFTKTKVIDYDTAKTSNEELFAKFFRSLLKQGIYTAPSKYEAWFITIAHSAEDIKKTIKAIEIAFKEMKV